MSPTEVPVDVDVLRHEIRKTYTEVSIDQDQDFIFPTGRAWAQELGYPEPELARIPDATVESFAGAEGAAPPEQYRSAPITRGCRISPPRGAQDPFTVTDLLRWLLAGR